MFRTKEEFKAAFIERLETLFGEHLDDATLTDKYAALSTLIREIINKRWYKSNMQYRVSKDKQVYYFSMEFLLGRLLGSNLFNLGLTDLCREGLAELGIDLAELEAVEADAGLGNGGLGRLAACFLDSMASLQLPGHGNGIRYRHGMFEQKIVDGYQMELPDNWLRDGYVWEMRKASRAVTVKFGGTVRMEERAGRLVAIHENYEPVLAVPYDIPVVGANRNTVNTLRLWSAETNHFDFSSFSKGDFLKAVEQKYSMEATSQILYPDDNYPEGKVLRLKQQYFFVSAGLQSIVRRYKRTHGGTPADLAKIHEKIAIHINDTHPALAVPELMRILLDEEGLGWAEAWNATCKTISYTNHTILPEALEKWPVELVGRLLPRMYTLIREINERFCAALWEQYPGDWDKIRDMAIISEGYVHMAHLAVVGSHSVNGVAEVHSNILKQEVMANFHKFYPHRFNNKTNGVTHRRWLAKANPALADLISETIGQGWLDHPTELANLHRYGTDAAFQASVKAVKQANKERLAQYIKAKMNITVDTQSIFDVHVKRIHAYKRQTLNALHILDLYNRLKADPSLDIEPRTFIFAGKSAAGYYLAKRIIKFINTLAQVINNDPDIGGRIKVVFMENYSVSLAELIIPAADVSEQISTASREASGTGNMKFMMNGAVTIGTLDGANIEIHDEVGDDNIVIFGLTADEVLNYYKYGGYNVLDVYNSNPRLKQAVDQLINGFFPVSADEFDSIHHSLMRTNDEYFVLKDFAGYAAAQEKVGNLYRDQSRWQTMSINNIAFSGRFASDRTISEYAIGIWQIKPVVIREF
ncbi:MULTISPECIES: glycogen/starch/alpha-glucan phosphorylase [Sporomusa]|jgi:starch phosphorylase|uniref:Alpha-1,4 glucan phosphorylase n=2 Tax=Sporomusa TaxID=2375 RepID=A0ABM9W1K7_9FIRM|nr:MULTISPECIES: glycogen/starch/alpha-glucan phosphorylase [Sporomusa]MCM0761395.1 glycogen/starch/alpha-glucan phosphorylase [Sporomusa sphaeroides DSM 2875]OLS56594.1 glycogen phosphorylase [Sporomusa sphaeroides DSM 2875]CVK19038.1 Glycogen phosphorylase [Sporomusa sphaeroides DSM 2875]SCM82145.1 glycogen phosphorylase [uncultured Sporomusa sp.]HML32589.1 glycogen/starch/alpha-glucan phosphorylase [Sporomusa sphaeroides]